MEEGHEVVVIVLVVLEDFILKVPNGIEDNQDSSYLLFRFVKRPSSHNFFKPIIIIPHKFKLVLIFFR